MSHTTHGRLAACFMILSACAGAETGGGEPATGGSAEGLAVQALCTSNLERQRQCTDTFLPALVELRISLDKPAGIAETAREEGREVLIATAHEEWKEDSTDAAISRTCAQVASHPEAAKMTGPMRDCLDRASCEDYVPCAVELLRGHLAAQ